MTRRKFVARTTDSNHDGPVAANRLDRDFAAGRPDRKWACDITYVPTRRGRAVRGGGAWTCAAAGSSAGHGRPHADRPVPGRAGHGAGGRAARAAACCTTATAACSTRASTTRGCCDRKGITAQHEPAGRLLRQRGDGELLGHAEDRVGLRGPTYETRERPRSRSSSTSSAGTIARRRHSALGYVSPEQFEAALN